MSAKCKYESEFKKCDYPVWGKDESLCIFHSELIEEKKNEFKPQFEKHLAKLIDIVLKVDTRGIQVTL